MSITSSRWLRLAGMLSVGLSCLAIEPTFAHGLRAEPSATQDTLPTVDRILEWYVEAVGGRAAIERLQTRIVHASFVEDIPDEGPVTTVRFDAYAQVPGKFLLEWRSVDGADRLGFDGSIGWEVHGDTVRRKDDVARRKEAFLFDPQGPLHVRDYFGELAVAGTARVGDRVAYAIRTDRRDAHYALYFDVETGLLIRIGYFWDLADYRMVDGVMIAFRITASRKGGSDTYVIATIEHNVAMDARRFAIPR